MNCFTLKESMKISQPITQTLHNRLKFYQTKLDLNHKHILDLGCGSAHLSRMLIEENKNLTLVAMEIDPLQHAKNLQTPHNNIEFVCAGAQEIPENDATFDIVFMFKSLHHVPIPLMGKSLNEIHRVLKPTGKACIVEPIYDGKFNDLLKIFHDEKKVREAAFSAIKNAVQSKLFKSANQHFFFTETHYDNFEDFENRVLNVTHTDHQLSPTTFDEVKIEFSKSMFINGVDFLVPIRIDILQKQNIVDLC